MVLRILLVLVGSGYVRDGTVLRILLMLGGSGDVCDETELWEVGVFVLDGSGPSPLSSLEYSLPK